jgi:hypothetical protein
MSECIFACCGNCPHPDPCADSCPGKFEPQKFSFVEFKGDMLLITENGVYTQMTEMKLRRIVRDELKKILAELNI